MQTPALKVGIEDLSVYIPGQYLPIETLAAERGLEYEKLSKGLGLLKMAVPGLDEDAASMAANAVAELIERNQLDPRKIGRLYIGTESGVDGSKPLASYVLGMLEARLAERYGPHALHRCDVVDMTFACIGAVDALQNTLDWVRANPEEIGIVIATDIAKYELASTGEYTQGAGAVALLVKADPALLSIENCWGVGTQDVHDFFKPLRAFSKENILLEAMDILGMDRSRLNGHAEHLATENQPTSVLKQSDTDVQVWRETPVFDGPYSNACYQDRIREALQHFQQKAREKGLVPGDSPAALTRRWASLVFHLPYAFHGKRIASEWFMLELKQQKEWPVFARENELEALEENAQKDPKGYGQLLRAVSKTRAYRQFVADKIERGQRASSQVGNLYTASIFMALASTLDAALQEKLDWTGQRLGFIAYGSGSKSKVFEGELQQNWQEKIAGLRLQGRLDQRRAMDYHEYELLHRRRAAGTGSGTGFYLAEVEQAEGVRKGARRYAHR